LTDVLHFFRKYNLEPKKIQFIYPRKNEEANILLVEGKKKGRPGLKVIKPLISHKENGDYTDEIKKYFE